MPRKLLFFHQPAGCPECDRMAEVWSEVKREAAGLADFREIPIVADNAAVQHYRVEEHPVTILEEDGRELKRWTGVTTKEEILAALRPASAAGAKPPSLEIPSGPALPGGPVPARQPGQRGPGEPMPVQPGERNPGPPLP